MSGGAEVGVICGPVGVSATARGVSTATGGVSSTARDVPSTTGGVSPSTGGVFTQRTNPVTGRLDWHMQHADYDYQQEVARAAYADMLHDSERNIKYEAGLRAAVAQLRAAGRPVHVLDIGTGTGLLAMMAARLGADSVTACEAFQPMTECAAQVLRDNGLADRVKLIGKRSTDLTVASAEGGGDDGDLPRRCNLLVTEVFDTELIGEGALSTFRHAHAVLLEPDSLVVPSSAVVYAQLVESPTVRRWNRFTAPMEGLHVPEDVTECHGAASVHDLQLSQLSAGSFAVLCDPVPVFGFDWTGRQTPLALERTSVAHVQAVRSGTAHAVFMWWDITMDPQGEVLLSCAPHWAHPDTCHLPPIGDSKKTPQQLPPWRDHWMQAVYYLPREIRVRRREHFNLVSSHDEYSLWFSANDAETPPVPGKVSDPAPICLCGLHVTLSRTRAGAMNDPRRQSVFLSALRRAINSHPAAEPPTVLVLSDACLYAVCAARLGAKRVYVLETSKITRRALQMYCRENDVDECVEFVEPDTLLERLAGQRVDIVFAEPFYYGTTLLPWHALHFWYSKQRLVASAVITDKTQVIPHSARLYGAAVEFSDLWKIRAPVGAVEGLQLGAFDRLVESASCAADEPCEPQPLWEYPGRALSRPCLLDTYSIAAAAPADVHRAGALQLDGDGRCNGVALWVDWQLDACGDSVVTTGPVTDIQPGHRVDWDMYTRQGVYLIRPAPAVTAGQSRLAWTYRFYSNSGEVDVQFRLALQSADGFDVQY